MSEYYYHTRDIGGDICYYKKRKGDRLWSFTNKEDYELHKGMKKHFYKGGEVESIEINTPKELGAALKRIFKNKYGVTIKARYIKTVRGLEGSPYQISSFDSGQSIPNDLRKRFVEIAYSKPFDELNVRTPNNVNYGNISEFRVSLKGNQWKKWIDEISNEKKEEPKEVLYISYLNKDKGFKEDKKYFSFFDEAQEWGRANLENFNTDMIRYEDKKVENLDEIITNEAKVDKMKEWRKYVLENSSWFEDHSEEEPFNNEIILVTRDNGSVGDEEVGEEDVDEAKKIIKKVVAKYPKTQYELEEVDEWVYLRLMPNKTKEQLSVEKTQYEQEEIKQESAKLIAKQLNITNEKAIEIVENFSYAKEYYDKYKDSKPNYNNAFRVYYKHGSPMSIKFDNAKQVFDYITKDSFAKDIYSRSNPRNEVSISLYGWDSLRINFDNDARPIKPNGSVDWGSEGKVLRVSPFIAVNIENEKDFIKKIKKVILDFIIVYKIYVLNEKNISEKNSSNEIELVNEINSELSMLNELLDDAKEDSNKELISELEDRIEFLEELRDDALPFENGGLLKDFKKIIVKFNDNYTPVRLDFYVSQNSKDLIRIGGATSSVYLDSSKVLNLQEINLDNEYNNPKDMELIISAIKKNLRKETGKTQLMIKKSIQ